MKYHNVTLLPSGLTVRVSHGSLLSEILARFDLQMPCGSRGVCGNCRVRLLKGTIAKTPLHKETLIKKNIDDPWYLACQSRVEDDLTLELPSNEMLIETEVPASDKVAGVGNGKAGIAVDLGSTTIVAQLVDISTGRILSSSEGINPQTAYGADIISRIAFAMKSPSNTVKLMEITRECIGEHIGRLLHYIPEGSEVTTVVIAGNTAMHHFFAGLDVKPLSQAPFCSPTNGAYSFSPSQPGWNMLPPQCSIELLPNISHFIGSDILCGIQACGIADSDDWQMLIDLGTNGEIVLGHQDKIYCTSTAAGPAFEGLNIACGMRASSGAVYAVEHPGNNPVLLTVGNDLPRGICGSGLIETIEYLLSTEKIDFTGAFTDPDCELFTFAPDVFISAQDIREFQLAKAALCAGVELLLKEAGLKAPDVRTVYLTGGLGYHINLAKMQAVGLFKNFAENQFEKVTNSALAGARLNLNRSTRDMIPAILSRMEFCALESNPCFQDIFCREMFFPSDLDSFTIF